MEGSRDLCEILIAPMVLTPTGLLASLSNPIHLLCTGSTSRQPRIVRTVVAVTLLLASCVFSSCVTAKSDEQTVRSTEARLNDAGFTKVTVDTPSESLQDLPTDKLNQFKDELGQISGTTIPTFANVCMKAIRPPPIDTRKCFSKKRISRNTGQTTRMEEVRLNKP